MTPEQEREARLRAVRMMQERPDDVTGVRSTTRALGRALAERGTQPLRDELARDAGDDMDDEDSVMGKKSPSVSDTARRARDMMGIPDQASADMEARRQAKEVADRRRRMGY